MGDLLEQKKLRQVNIHTGPIEAVSQRMSLGNMEDFMQQKQQMQDEELIMEIPAEEKVIEAHKDVGLKLQPGSLKHPQRVKRAAQKKRMQHELVEKSKFKPAKDLEKGQAREHFAHFEVSKLLFAEDKKNTYETLLAHYEEIKQELSYIDVFEKEILASKEYEITDEERAKLATLQDVRAFYTLHERLMTNKYYVMLPHAEMHKLPYDELRKRLDTLYKDKNKNEELINYYQDLIRLQQLGISDTKSIGTRQKEYLDQFTQKTKEKEDEEEGQEHPVEAMKSIQAAYTALKKSLDGDDKLIFDGTESRLLRTFFAIYGPDLEKYKGQLTKKELTEKADFTLEAIVAEYQNYKEKKENKREKTADDEIGDILKNTTEDEGEAIGEDDGQGVEGITLSKEQLESARQVDKLLMQKALKDDQLSFGTTLLGIKEEERLLVYYMVENGKTAQSLSGEDFFTVMKNYVPSPEAIQKKGDWKSLSMALRSYKPAFNDIVEFGKLEEESKKAMEQAKSKAEDKEKAIAEAIQKKLDLVSMLYRKAGMPPSMPPDMAKDPVLRQRLVAECQSIMGMGVALEVLSKRIKEAGDAGKAPQNAKDGVAPEELDSSIESEITIESILTADQLVGGIMNGGLAFSDAKIGKAYLSAAYQGYSNMKDGILSIVGFLGAIATTVMVAKDASMSVADRTAEGMSLGGTYATTIVGAANAFYGFTLRGIAEESLSKAQVFTRDTLGNVMGGVMVAAGAIEIAASSIQLGRALSTEKDIQKAKDLLIKKKTEEKQKNQTEQNKTEQAEAKKDRTKLAEKTTLTKDERILARFLLHQNREASRKEVGAGIGIATGAMSVATGALMLAGAVTFAPALAVLAFVGIGVAVAKLATNCAMKKKNREAAVDDFLNVDEKFQMVLAKKKEMAGAGGKATKINEKKLRAAVRKEALAKLGYTSYMDCYRYIVAQAAELLYNKNFVHVPEDETEKQMYSAALDSLGLKTSKNKVQGEEQHPTAAEIYKKLLTA